MDTVKIEGRWYERRWTQTSNYEGALMSYSLRPLTEFESKRAEDNDTRQIED